MARVPFTFRRHRKTMRGGLDPVEMQRRSAEARKRKRAQDSLAGRLERVALQMVSDPATPAHVRERLLARLTRSSSAEPAVDVGTSEVRGVSLASILESQGDDAEVEHREEAQPSTLPYPRGGTEQRDSHTHNRRLGLSVRQGAGLRNGDALSLSLGRSHAEKSSAEESSGDPAPELSNVWVDNLGREHELPYGRHANGTPNLQPGHVETPYEEAKWREWQGTLTRPYQGSCESDYP